MEKNIIIADFSVEHIMSVCTLVEDTTDFNILATTTRWETLPDQVRQLSSQTNLLLLDTGLYHDISTLISFILLIQVISPDLHIILQSMYAIGSLAYRMQNLDIPGYVLKDCQGSELLTAMQAVAGGNTYYQPEILHARDRFIQHAIPRKEPSVSLTQTEKQIIRLIRLGYHSGEIRNILQLHQERYEALWRNLTKKFGSKDPLVILDQCIYLKLLG